MGILSKEKASDRANFLQFINNANLINELYCQNNGFIIEGESAKNEKSNGKNAFATLLDLGKYFNNQNGDIAKIFEKGSLSTKELDTLATYIKKEIVCTVPNTFFMLTNLPFEKWFEENSIISNVLNAYPCYNLFVITEQNISENALETSNQKRKVIDDSDTALFYDYATKIDLNINKFNCISVVRFSDLLKVFDDYRIKSIPMILPLNNPLEKKENYKGKGILIDLKGFETKNNLYFNSKLNASTKALLYENVDFNSFYNAEISLNLFNVFEGVRYITNETNGKTYQTLFFYSFLASETANTYDTSDLKDSINGELYEDKLISDIYTAVPIRYEDIETLKKARAKDNNFIVNNILTGLAFQDNYEFGNDSGNIVNNAERIERIDLGSISITLTEEPHYNYYKKTTANIITKKPFDIRLIASLDKETHTGVLYLLNLGVKMKPTKYLNEVSCNRLSITYNSTDKYCDKLKQKTAQDGTILINLYTYLKAKFKIKRVGVPRHLILSPFLDDFDLNNKVENNKNKINNEKSIFNNDKNINIKANDKINKLKMINTYRQIKSSLLYGEAMFEEGEELGKIVDSSLNNTFKYRYGDSVYDYNVMNISKISVLQYSDTYKDYLAERIDFAVVNLFYLELLALEESAIKIANMSISNFIKDYRLKDKTIANGKNGTHNTASKLVLNRLEEIQEEYTKTLDFWNSQTNYYSSNEILNKMRKKFEIQKDVENLKRNHKEIQQIYDNRQQNASGKSTFIISIVGIILTVLNILEIYSSAVTDPQENQFLTGVEKVLFENLSAVNVIRIALVLILCYYFIYLLVKSSFNRRKHF